MKTFKNKGSLFRTTFILFLILTLGSISAGVGKDNIDLTKDNELRNEVFQQIISNKDLLYKFMNSMMNNQQSMYWMMENGGMMQQMFNQNNLQYIMSHNMNMSNYMFNHMMLAAQNDSTIRMQWNNMMNGNYRNGNGNMGMGNMMYNH